MPSEIILYARKLVKEIKPMINSLYGYIPTRPRQNLKKTEAKIYNILIETRKKLKEALGDKIR